MKRALLPLLLPLLLVAALLGGCASVPQATSAAPAAASKVDPWESFNRKVFAFNEALDEAVVRPVAEVYRDVVAALVRQGVANFFGNIGDVWSTANHFLQGKLASGLEMTMRVSFNTVFGIAGVLDPATEMKMPRRSEDFGQTLAVWGVGNGPYVVLPLFGPSTLRDSLVWPVDRWATTPSRYFDDVNTYLMTPLQVVQVRADLLQATQLASQVSLDKYVFFRDAFLSRRLDQIYDGAPPLAPLDDDPGDSPPKK